MNKIKKIDISLPIGTSEIHGNLNMVENSKSIIVFAHGSGSSRFSTRNQFVAQMLNNANFSTFLFDLLTKEEERIDVVTAEFRFNLELLSKRLIFVTQWIRSDKRISDFNIGYFGASTGAAAALIAAAKSTTVIFAIVSRGGRPDLAIDYLKDVKAPTLLIIGELDFEVIELNKFAYENLNCEKKMGIIPNATHLFEEGNTLEQAANLAIDWFKEYE